MKKLILLTLILTACQSSPEVGDWDLVGWQNNGSGACAAPDSTYPISINETWQNLSYSLPWCWTASEVENSVGETVLRLDHGEGESYAEINVTKNREDLEENWGPAENTHGNYDYYQFLVRPGITLFERFEGDYKIEMITLESDTGIHSGALLILESLTLTQ